MEDYTKGFTKSLHWRLVLDVCIGGLDWKLIPLPEAGTGVAYPGLVLKACARGLYSLLEACTRGWYLRLLPEVGTGSWSC